MHPWSARSGSCCCRNTAAWAARRSRTPDTDPETRILGACRILHRVETAALDVGRRGGGGGNAAIGRIGDDGRAEGLDGASAELAEDRIVGAGADVLRGVLGRRLLIAFRDLACPLRGFFGR